jgi:protein-disulfide isomerase
MNKKEEYRLKRKTAEKRKNILIIVGIVVLVAAIAGVIIYGQINSHVNVITITPKDYPQVDHNSMGDPNALVKVDIYSDFQCPYCKKLAEEVEPTIVEKYVSTGKVYMTYHPYRLIGPESDNAAAAAYCAGDQGKYWQYHDLLFANWTAENVGDFSSKKVKAYAASLGLDTAVFNQCYDSGKYTSQLAKDQAAGDAIPLQFTPSVFINGKLDENGDYLNSIESALAGK